jgi:putative acetyltransferase
MNFAPTFTAVPAHTLVIESVEPQHPDALALLAEAGIEARELYPELFAADTPAPTNLPLRPREVYLIARQGGQPVGCGALRNGGDHGELRRMFVTAGARRLGIARRLVHALERQAQALGYRRLLLETGTRQTPAIALYTACGWQRVPPFGPYVGDPTSVCFGKTL